MSIRLVIREEPVMCHLLRETEEGNTYGWYTMLDVASRFGCQDVRLFVSGEEHGWTADCDSDIRVSVLLCSEELLIWKGE